MENQAACGLAGFFYVQGITPHKMMFAAWKYTLQRKDTTQCVMPNWNNKIDAG